MRTHCRYHLTIALLLVGTTAQAGHAKVVRVGVVQTVIEKTLGDNRDKLLVFMGQAKAEGCDIVIFPEGALYWADIATHRPTIEELDAAIAQIAEKANHESVTVVFGVGYRQTDREPYRNRGVVFDPDGRRLLFYGKNVDVPERFCIHGVSVNLVICSDRWYLEHCDLPCLVQGSRVIIDISGGHGGDDGRPDLRWIRYRPWAERTGAYVIVSNPVHDDTDFMGHSPWGGGSAIVRPDGSIQVSLTHEKDVLIVEDIHTDAAERIEAQRRREHPVFKPFWDMGKRLLEAKVVNTVADIAPYHSAERDVTIAAAQIVCSRDIGDNVRRITAHIWRAAEQGADVVVFPELAVTGNRKDDIFAAGQPELDNALRQVRREADGADIHVIVGMPHHVDGHRQNCALVIGDDGSIKTRYAQLAAKRRDLFRPGTNAGAMWFELKGVHSIVTIGDDAKWIEIGDLAASRGMVVHFHITNEVHSSADEAILCKQRHLVMLAYAQYGAVVNAASAIERSHANAVTGGTSMIVSREGGHGKPAPSGIEYYLPYQTSIVKSAGTGETMIVATRKTSARNDMDLDRHWRNRNRRNRPQSGWYEWMKEGAKLIERGAGASAVMEIEVDH